MLEYLNSVDAERAVLAAIIYDERCSDLVHALHPSDFSVPEHSEILAWIARDVDAGRKPTAMSIVTNIGSMRCGEVTAATYVIRLREYLNGSTAREAVSLVKELAARRLLIDIGDTIKTYAREPENLPKGIALEAIKALDGVTAMGGRAERRPQSVFDTASELVDRLDDSDDGSFISTGLRSLDGFMGGWPRGELSIIAGRPSMGKSAVMSAMARRGAKCGVNILIFSLEMPRSALAARMLSDFAYSIDESLRIPYANILQKQLSEIQKGRLMSALDAFRQYPIVIDDQRGLTMTEIKIRTMRHAEELDRDGRRLDIVMIDHIGKISPGDRYKGNVTQEVGEKSNALMNLAFDANVAMVAAHQLNRNPEGRDDKHPTQADLRDSGHLEQDAHTIIFPYRHAYYLERQKLDDPEKDRIRMSVLEKKKNLLEILVAKCRNGAAGTIEVFVDMASNHVSDLGGR